MKRNTDEKIWEWFLILEDYKRSGMPQTDYCRKFGYPKENFIIMIRRIYFKKENELEYKKNIDLVKKYHSSGMSRPAFCKANNVKQHIITDGVSHLNYKKVIDLMKVAKGYKDNEPQMKFISVPNPVNIAVNHPQSFHQEAEVIEEPNSIELKISKGIHVTLDPKFPSEKLIKVIEFLKGL